MEYLASLYVSQEGKRLIEHMHRDLHILKVLPTLLFPHNLSADRARTTSRNQRHFSISTSKLEPAFLRTPKSYLFEDNNFNFNKKAEGA